MKKSTRRGLIGFIIGFFVGMLLDALIDSWLYQLLFNGRIWPFK